MWLYGTFKDSAFPWHTIYFRKDCVIFKGFFFLKPLLGLLWQDESLWCSVLFVCEWKLGSAVKAFSTSKWHSATTFLIKQKWDVGLVFNVSFTRWKSGKWGPCLPPLPFQSFTMILRKQIFIKVLEYVTENLMLAPWQLLTMWRQLIKWRILINSYHMKSLKAISFSSMKFAIHRLFPTGKTCFWVALLHVMQNEVSYDNRMQSALLLDADDAPRLASCKWSTSVVVFTAAASCNLAEP